MLRKTATANRRGGGVHLLGGSSPENEAKLQALAEQLGLNVAQKSADDGDLAYDMFKACMTHIFKLYAKRPLASRPQPACCPCCCCLPACCCCRPLTPVLSAGGLSW